jgi:glycosyltransferase involved in cell wall biosynthesis
VHVVRSYLAPLGLAVAERLGSPWASLDLDDDDETLAAHDDAQRALAYHRLVATFAPRFSLVGLASPLDADAVGRRHRLQTVCLPNAVAVPARRPRPQPDSDTVLFVGNLTYTPNVEAAVFLAERVRPALQAVIERPVHIVLVGPYLPGGPIGALSAHPSVTVTGFVDDLDPVYRRAGVVVAPLTTGSGTRIKLLEAFAQGVPVVTTPVGAAGLDVCSGEQLLIASSLHDLVEATAAILSDASLSDRLAEAAFEFVRRHHAPEVSARLVRRFLCAAGRAAPPP